MNDQIKEAERKLRLLGDTLRKAAKHADQLDLKPEVKTWLLEQFGPNKPKTMQPVTDKTLDYTREVISQLEELGQQAKPTSGKNRHAEKEQQRRESKKGDGDLPTH